MAAEAGAAAAGLSRFFSLHARASGGEVLGAYLILMGIGAVLAAVAEFFFSVDQRLIQSAIMTLVIPTFVRRMHDNRRSGWWAIIPATGLVPRAHSMAEPPYSASDLWPLLLTPFFFWGIYLLVQASDGDPSRYGPDPRIPQS